MFIHTKFCFRRYQTNIVQDMFDTITMIQPKGSGGGSEVTREDKVSAMTTDMLEKLPSVFNMFDIKERYGSCFIRTLKRNNMYNNMFHVI